MHAGDRHGREVQSFMERLYELAGDACGLLDRLVEQKEAFAREACLHALQAAAGIHAKALLQLPRTAPGEPIADCHGGLFRM